MNETICMMQAIRTVALRHLRNANEDAAMLTALMAIEENGENGIRCDAIEAELSVRNPSFAWVHWGNREEYVDLPGLILLVDLLIMGTSDRDAFAIISRLAPRGMVQD